VESLLGVWDWLLNLIWQALEFLYLWVGDLGWAIVLLTVLIRLLMIPLTAKQTRSMHEMQRIQPKIKEIQKKYKDDKQKQQEEMMKFYQENKVNPFGGCLPLLIQMPVFIALFQVLRNLPERLPDASPSDFAWMIGGLTILPDLTISPSEAWSLGFWVALPYLIFVVLFGLSGWLPQRMLSQDKQQSRIGMYMSVMLLYFGWISPGGVLVYWVTSSMWQVGQQAILLRWMKRDEGDD
jgi:YidC/Oxa1 family membrane protein insertase